MVKVTDERLGQLSESQISQPILLPDELSEILANLSVSPDTALRHIDALMGAEFTDMLVHEGEKGGLCLDAALQGLLDILSLEVRSLFHKHIESLLDGKQQLPDVLVGFHGFLALALQSAGTRIPKRWSARQLAGELRHSPVHRDASHDGSFSILVHSALFQVEQHLEFFDFHNAYILSVQI